MLGEFREVLLNVGVGPDLGRRGKDAVDEGGKKCVRVVRGVYFRFSLGVDEVQPIVDSSQERTGKPSLWTPIGHELE